MPSVLVFHFVVFCGSLKVLLSQPGVVSEVAEGCLLQPTFHPRGAFAFVSNVSMFRLYSPASRVAKYARLQTRLVTLGVHFVLISNCCCVSQVSKGLVL